MPQSQIHGSQRTDTIQGHALHEIAGDSTLVLSLLNSGLQASRALLESPARTSERIRHGCRPIAGSLSRGRTRRGPECNQSLHGKRSEAKPFFRRRACGERATKGKVEEVAPCSVDPYHMSSHHLHMLAHLWALRLLRFTIASSHWLDEEL
jgi:hypothetical protein